MEVFAMRDEIGLLKEARPQAGGPSPEVTSRARVALMADIAGARRTTPWWRRRLLRVAAPAFAAAVAAIVLGLMLTGKGSEPAWAAALVRVAEAAPRLLVDEEGWEITRADQFSVDYGEMTLAKDGQELELKWLPASEYAQAVDKRVVELDDLGTATAAGAEARLFRYPGTSDHVAVWLDGSSTVEARGLAPDADAFRATLASLDEVDVDTWLSAMPASVVQPAMRAEVVDEMLAGIPLPPGFERTEIATGSALRDRYQLGAEVTGAVACAWIDRWVAARRSGDEAGARAAVDAMATSSTWPVLEEMEDEGAYPQVLREYAAAMATNGDVPAGKPGLTVEGTYRRALGCPVP
jgi:hypothetical protein